MMRIFCGGQIQPECQGDLTLIISRQEDRQDSGYDAAVYKIGSKEFIEATGIRIRAHPIERMYIGISKKHGNTFIKEIQNHYNNRVDLDIIDNYFVSHNFRNSNSEKPKKIILESTSTGYQIIEQK